jgi:shikimate kinase
MGSGKSYVGQRLALAMGYDFIDLDMYIVENEGLTITKIFKIYDENYFREKEAHYLKTFADRKNTIIATGGGAPCFFDNMTWIKNNGISIYLKPNENLLFQRLIKEAERRPLLRDFTPDALQIFIQNKIAERSIYYEKADFIVAFDEKNQCDLVEIIKLKLRN